MKYFLLLFAFLSTAHSLLQAQPDQSLANLFEETSQYIYEIRKDYMASGSYIIATQNQDIFYESVNGMANVEHQVTVSDSTIFDLASIAKMFTGYAIATLEEEQLLSSSDDIRKYLPAFPDYGHTITVGHLVHHTSGVKNWTSLLRTMDWGYGDQISFDQLIRLIYAQTELDFTPGEKYQYSNSGYNLLAKIVEEVSGESFVDWMQSHVFTPLDMDHSFINDQQHRIIPNLAQGYFLNNSGEQVRDFNQLIGLGSSSLFSTGRDMVKWMNFLMHPPEEKQAIVARMFQTDTFNNGKRNHYAYGIELDTHKDMKYYQHSGGWASHNTHLLLLPEQDAAVFVAHNFRTNTWRVLDLYTDAFLPKQPEAAEKSTAPASPKTAEKAFTMSPDQLDQFLGIYQLDKGWFVDIHRIGDQLFSTANGENAAPMTPLNDSTFLIRRYGNRTMTFRKNAQGESYEMRYNKMNCPKIDLVDAEKKESFRQYEGYYFNPELELMFTLKVEADGLYAKSIKHGNIKLIYTAPEEFMGGGVLRSLRFSQDSTGKLEGFYTTNWKGENRLKFLKMARE